MSIEELLDSKRVAYHRDGHHHCRPGWLQLDCPFCGPGSSKFHLGYNIAARYFNCWKCGGHSIYRTLQILGIADVAKAARSLKADGALVAPRRKAGRLKEPAGVGPMLPIHRRYLRGRGFDPQQIEEMWQVGGFGLQAELAWRLYLPVVQNGQQVTWTTRAATDNVEVRYLSAPLEESDIDIKDTIYGLDFCSHGIVVVEGPTDAWRIGPGAGALFGTAFTPAQVALLARFPVRVICFDSEPTAQQQAQELANQLSCFPGRVLVVELDADDPGNASPAEVRRLRKLACL